MAASREIGDALKRIVDEWNLAEKSIKLAEQVDGKIVNPAIYELRYSGRRLTEAILLPDTDARKLDLLKDAHFDCCRARHDAMDAATSKIAADIDLALERLDAQRILTQFPQITALLNKLGSLRDKIAVSREDRGNRNAIYATIQENSLPEIVAIYREFKASEGLLVEAADQERAAREELVRRADTAEQAAAKSNRLAVIALAVAALMVLVSIYFGVQPK